ncbi:hypothetical protein ACVW06_003662 [Pantoea ananatis]
MLNCMLVTILEPKRIVVQLKGAINRDSELRDLGFSKKGESYDVNFEGEKEQLFLIEKLAEMGALFSYGQGWAPSQVMDYLKEKGKIKFPYREIMWRSPGNYEIIEHK